MCLVPAPRSEIFAEGTRATRGTERRPRRCARQSKRDVADHAVGAEIDPYRALIATQNVFEKGHSGAALVRWRDRGPAGFDPFDPNTVGENAPSDEEASLWPGEGAILRRVCRQLVEH
jgi:hypothetical protein